MGMFSEVNMYWKLLSCRLRGKRGAMGAVQIVLLLLAVVIIVLVIAGFRYFRKSTGL
jgi:hypothetical protein